MTSMAPEIEQVHLETFEFERPCTLWQGDCPHDGVATWRLVSLCCGLEIPLCDPCREITEAELKPRIGTIYECLACGGKHVTWKWIRIK